MKKLIEHFRDEMLIVQVIYEFNVNVNRRFCSRYLIDDQIWLNVKNLNIVRFVVKFDDHHINFFQVKRVFDKNFLIIELKFSKFMKIHFIFHATLFNHVINDFLLDQRQKSRELVVVENDERFWYVNRIFNFKIDRRYNSSLFQYYVDWENHFSIWELFHFINNCQKALDEFHVSNSRVASSHVEFCIVSRCQYRDLNDF